MFVYVCDTHTHKHKHIYLFIGALECELPEPRCAKRSTNGFSFSFKKTPEIHFAPIMHHHNTECRPHFAPPTASKYSGRLRWRR